MQVPRLLIGLTGSRLGWMDLIIPKPFILLCLLALAAALPFARDPLPRMARATALTWVLIVICYLTTYFLLYLQFNIVGGAEVKGVEGRYLTPLLLLGGAMLERRALAASRMRWLLVGIGGWALLSVLVTCVTVFHHYWAFA